MSEKRDSNPRPRPWQGRALPTELFSQYLCLLITWKLYSIFPCHGRFVSVLWGQGRALPTELFSQLQCKDSSILRNYKTTRTKKCNKFETFLIFDNIIFIFQQLKSYIDQSLYSKLISSVVNRNQKDTFIRNLEVIFKFSFLAFVCPNKEI